MKLPINKIVCRYMWNWSNESDWHLRSIYYKGTKPNTIREDKHGKHYRKLKKIAHGILRKRINKMFGLDYVL